MGTVNTRKSQSNNPRRMSAAHGDQTHPEPGGPLLTLEEAAERLGMTIWFTRQLVKERRIRYVKLGAAKQAPVRIREDVLEAFIAEHTIEATG